MHPRYTLLCFAVAAIFCSAIARAAETPNVIFILADDVGYGDLSCYGGKLIETPHLDRLAREGRRFTDAHSSATMCTPTRRALLTGTYSWREPAGSSILAGNAALCIPPGTPTLPSLLKQAGYATGIVGKWHLGLGGKGGPDWNAAIKPGPLELGFDYAYFLPATGDRVPCVYIEDHLVVGLDPADPIAVSYREKIGAEPTGRENPELLKLRAKEGRGHDGTIVNGIGRIGWMTGGQSARWVDEEMADVFAAKAVKFIERQRAQPFFLYLATHDIHAPQVPNARYQGTSGGTRAQVLRQLDDTVGKALAALDQLGLAGKTIVMFSSDNGGVPEDGYESVPSPEHRCNGALRGHKGSLYEGGHRVPFLARWPGHIPAATECSELVTLTDICATVAALAGVELPRGAALDSMNILPALLDVPHASPVRRTFITHGAGTNGPFGIRQDHWKLVQNDGGGIGLGLRAQRPARAPELYDLQADPRESRNLAASHPEKVAELLQLLTSEREQGRTRP